MTILVTGATGFLGTALVTELVKQQQPVRILARDAEKAHAQFGDAVAVITGEVTDQRQGQQAGDGITTIYHLVGRPDHPSVPTQLYYQTHFERTPALLEACRGQSQLPRSVQCSTTGEH